MKTSLLLWALALATLVMAQSINDLPSCSLSCFQAAVATTSCRPNNTVCQCTTGRAAMTASVTPCLSKSSCSYADLQNIQLLNVAICAKALSATSIIETSSASSTSASASSSQFTSGTASSSGTPGSVNNFGANTPGTHWKVTPQSKDHRSRGPAFEAVAISMFALSCFLVAFRFYARMRTRRQRQITRGLWVDEYLALVASILTAGVFGCLVAGVKNGMGKHLSDTSPNELIKTIKITYAFAINSILCLIALKLSILFLYLRMTPERTHKKTIWATIIVILAHGTAATLTTIFQCTPISSYWSIEEPQHCIQLLAFNIFNSTFGALEDVWIWILPIPVIARLQIPASKKVGLYFLIAVSGVSVVCSILRLSSIIVWVNSSDISWNFPLIPFFTTLEACVALITSSVPAIYPFLRKPQPNNSYHSMPTLRQAPSNGWRSQDSTLEERAHSRNDLITRPPLGKVAWPSRTMDRGGEVERFGTELKSIRTGQLSVTESAVFNDSVVEGDPKESTFWIHRKSEE